MDHKLFALGGSCALAGLMGAEKTLKKVKKRVKNIKKW
jgi:hypothetical protein